MKFECETKELLDAIVLAKQFIMKNSLSILSCIYLEVKDNKLIIKFTNLRSSGKICFDVQNGENGSILLRIEKLDSILKKMNYTIVKCYVKNEYFCINNIEKTISFKMKLLEEGIDKFPGLPEIKEEYFIKLKKNELYDMINKTIFILSKDNDSYFTNGVFCELKDEKIILTSTDGKRLSTVFLNKDIKEDKEIVISFDIVNILKNYLLDDKEVSLFIDDKYICLKFDNIVFYSTLLVIKYPNYRKVIPDYVENEVVINRLELKKAIECVCLVSDDMYKLYLNLSKNKIVLRSNNSILGEGENVIECEYNGEEKEIILDYHFLYDPLQAMNSDDIILGFNNVEKPLLLKEKDNDNYINIIVPLIRGKSE